ncbi:MAG: T9SS type A sorting domain-containing protein [Bacteroidia bacterium]|nr:T9SS type A sorting domain-containing protein [Bacteroidia bacterium]
MNVLKLGKGILLFMLFIQWNISGALGQTSVNASGGQASGSGGSVSFSIGQVLFTAHQGNTHKKSLGVQQAAEIFLNVGLEEDLLNFQAAAYPNPTIRDVILSIPEVMGKKLDYVILDMAGRQVSRGSISQTETSISFKSFPKGRYFLRVSLENHTAKSFNIIKN